MNSPTIATSNIKPVKKNSKHYIIPASYFKNKGITPIPIEIPKEKIAKQLKVDKNPDGDKEESADVSTSKHLKALQVKEPPKIILNQDKRTSGLSLSSIRAKKEHQIKQMEVVIDEEDLPKDDFNEKELLETWNTYTKMLQDKGQFNLASILAIDTPKLIGTSIHLEFPNATNKVEVERQQYDLLAFIRKTLNNYDINLNITVNEEMERKYAYTTQEKFEKLKEKNPNLDVLRKTFDLDI